jgi:hypothetical protein
VKCRTVAVSELLEVAVLNVDAAEVVLCLKRTELESGVRFEGGELA